MASDSSLPAVDKSGDRVRDMFAQIAPRYDLLNHLRSLGIDISWRKKVVRRVRLDQDLPVLDCCTGTGDLALMLAARLQGRVEVVGADFCPEMLAIATDKYRRGDAHLPVRFVEADAQQLPFADGTFQAVTVAFGLRNVQDTDRGLAELFRVCAAGGQVAILEFAKPSLLGLKQLYQFYFLRVLPRLGQRLASNSLDAYRYLPQSVVEFPSGRQLAERMERSGLTNVRYYPFTLGVAMLYVGDKPADESPTAAG